MVLFGYSWITGFGEGFIYPGGREGREVGDGHTKPLRCIHDQVSDLWITHKHHIIPPISNPTTSPTYLTQLYEPTSFSCPHPPLSPSQTTNQNQNIPNKKKLAGWSLKWKNFNTTTISCINHISYPYFFYLIDLECGGHGGIMRRRKYMAW